MTSSDTNFTFILQTYYRLREDDNLSGKGFYPKYTTLLMSPKDRTSCWTIISLYHDTCRSEFIDLIQQVGLESLTKSHDDGMDILYKSLKDIASITCSSPSSLSLKITPQTIEVHVTKQIAEFIFQYIEKTTTSLSGGGFRGLSPSGENFHWDSFATSLEKIILEEKTEKKEEIKEICT